MRILLLCHSFNSLSQRLFVELAADGHELSVELDISPAVSAEAVALFRPDIVVAPFLRRTIPEAIWRQVPCLIVHPGPIGDRGPQALDWAILEDVDSWGITVLQATGELDAGPVWGHCAFPMRAASKSSLYRNEVTEAAVIATRAALTAIRSGAAPVPVAQSRWRGPVPAAARAIDWQRDDTATVLRKIRSADSTPGVADQILGRHVRLYDAAPASFAGEPGEIVGHSGESIARATTDGAVWIGRLRDVSGPHNFKLPATRILADALDRVPEIAQGRARIRFELVDGIGYLHFDLRNGAMGAAACRDLLDAYRAALASPARVIVLMGGADFWSNGMDLNLIEAADSPAEESWANINAIDDLAEAVIRTTDRLVIAALQGNAGAGGVFLARAADEVWCRRGVVLSPHYKDMGNLYGSEFWTYLLPRRVGTAEAARIMSSRLPMGSAEAQRLGLIDLLLPGDRANFHSELQRQALALANAPDLAARLAEKGSRRAADEQAKPLAAYRAEELARMRTNFFGFDQSYHVARCNFVAKVPKSRTPATIARHRQIAKPARMAS